MLCCIFFFFLSTVPQDIAENTTPDTMRWSSSSFVDTTHTNTQSTQPSPDRLMDLNHTHYLWLLFLLLFSALLPVLFKWIGARRVHQYWREYGVHKHIAQGAPLHPLTDIPGL